VLSGVTTSQRVGIRMATGGNSCRHSQAGRSRSAPELLTSIRIMVRHSFSHILTNGIVLIAVAFSTAAAYCYARDLDESSLNSKFINSYKDPGGSFFLSDKSIRDTGIARKDPGIFRSSYKGPPYVLEPHLKNNLLARIWRDFNVQLKTPIQFARKHPIRLGLAIISVGTLMATDRKTLSFFAPQEELQEGGLVKLGKSLSTYGEAVYALPIIGGLGLYGWVADSPRERETFRMLMEAVVTSAAWTGLLKVCSGREGPFQGESSDNDWVGPFGIFSGETSMRGKQFTSFPSGHSSAIFSLATILAHQYPKYYIVPVVSYSIATAVAYSRMVVDAHWFSDVVVGSALGYLCVRQVIRDNPEPVNQDGKISSVNIGFDF